MHELWLCKNILKILNEQAANQKCVRIKRVYLEIGQLAAVEKSALDLCFSVITKGSLAEHALLEIIEVPGEAQCPSCHKTLAVKHYYDSCRYCGNLSLNITKGEELRVKSMEVE